MGIQALLITKDRPMQADACLSSLFKFSGDLIEKVHIITFASNNEFYDGYKQYLNYNGPFYHKIQVTWEYVPPNRIALPFVTPAVRFREAFLSVLKQISENSDLVLGLTDDTLFHSPIKFTKKELLDYFDEDLDLCFSLRLGVNTKVQDIDTGKLMISPPDSSYDEVTHLRSGDKFLSWLWKTRSLDDNTGYPISLDGCIYSSKYLYNASASVPFNNLREWEGNLVGQERSNCKLPFMSCPAHSVCVNVPLNMVQPPWHKTVGPYGISALELNDKFTGGWEVDLDKMFSGVRIIGSHAYIKPEFKKGS